MRLFSLIIAIGLLAGGCGGAEVGEACDTSGAKDECVDGAICDTDGDDKTCLEICKEQEDCGAGEDCTGVSDANVKACHDKD